VVALGRAVGRAQIVGPDAGINELRSIAGRERLESYPFFWAALGDLALRAGQRSRARVWLERGATTARNEAERMVFQRRLAECGS
jgi:predicted RNA polymerase sigma factor